MNARDCPFCKRVRMQDYHNTMSGMALLDPVNPVVDGHLIAIPLTHVESFLATPVAAGQLTGYAASQCRLLGIQQANLILSAGFDATDSVGHIAVHIIPRKKGDGLLLPWSPQSKRKPRVGSAADILNDDDSE